MKEPKLTIALTERGDQPVLLISRNDNTEFNRTDVELRNLAALGQLGAHALIGEFTIRMLHAAHPDAFAPYPALQPEERLTTPDDGFSFLLHQSFRDRTRAYLPAMETLMEHHGDAISAIQREHWKEMRARIEASFPA